MSEFLAPVVRPRAMWLHRRPGKHETFKTTTRGKDRDTARHFLEPRMTRAAWGVIATKTGFQEKTLRNNWTLVWFCGHGEGARAAWFERFNDAVDMMQAHLDMGHTATLTEGPDNRYGAFTPLRLDPGMNARLALDMRED